MENDAYMNNRNVSRALNIAAQPVSFTVQQSQIYNCF
jgi:hypothetical protein